MTHTPNEFRDLYRAYQPPGAALNRDDDTDLGRLWLAKAQKWARAEQLAEHMLDQADPTTATEMLPDWARALGIPGGCIESVESMDELRALVVGKWSDGGDQSRQAYIDLAARFGFEIAITEGFRPFKCGRDRCGRKLNSTANSFRRRISTPTEAPVIKFRCGRSRCGRPLGGFARSLVLECAINEKTHAHVENVYAYGAEE